ncbi:MAG: isoprenylcysteine carboxylmethyltransferase family protein [Phaeovulum sp.]|uniref:methyltransferase family protein n=1 Tax=Phaeovulum sp. TaxID=2934796 RepID=UPI00273563E2|nr:isoprenylcysteine carboxylmethyltransferase family protein [Phaeovulum sp.]MDP3860009.1 isoprenylcysteine carboxylmethyltransferase family protein [Phaeovulum sp.]
MRRDVLDWLDLPPVWLAVFAATGWGAGQLWPVALPWGGWIGGGLVAAGVVLMTLAVAQMLGLRTTFIPRRDPSALVTEGVFRLSRNPIYLADALVLAGLLIAWQAVWALPLVAAFMAFIAHRFIRGEEARIAARFGAAWQDYAARTRRWL